MYIHVILLQQSITLPSWHLTPNNMQTLTHLLIKEMKPYPLDLPVARSFTTRASLRQTHELSKNPNVETIQFRWGLNRTWITQYSTYDIFPNGAKAALTSSVEISGLRSPTKTWKWSTIMVWGDTVRYFTNHQAKEKNYSCFTVWPHMLLYIHTCIH